MDSIFPQCVRFCKRTNQHNDPREAREPCDRSVQQLGNNFWQKTIIYRIFKILKDKM